MPLCVLPLSSRMTLTSLFSISALLILPILSAFATGSGRRSASGVPQDEPIPGNYSGPLRPQIHFSPPIDFMNDPNGCFLDADGTWHLYYQCAS